MPDLLDLAMRSMPCSRQNAIKSEAEGVKQLKKLRNALSDARYSMQRKGRTRGVRLHCTWHMAHAHGHAVGCC